MTKIDRITAAIKLAAEVHMGQVDKGGTPYILHCLHVMSTVELGGRFVSNEYEREALLCAAVLHDTLEDFQGTFGEASQLRDFMYQTFGDRAYSAIDTLTRSLHDDYLNDYIPRIAKDWIATRVKIADLTHNMDPTRMPDRPITEKDIARWDKYRRAIVILKKGPFDDAARVD